MGGDAYLEFRAWLRIVLAACLVVLVAAGGLWLVWDERDATSGSWCCSALGTLVVTTLLARLAPVACGPMAAPCTFATVCAATA